MYISIYNIYLFQKYEDSFTIFSENSRLYKFPVLVTTYVRFPAELVNVTFPPNTMKKAWCILIQTQLKLDNT